MTERTDEGSRIVVAAEQAEVLIVIGTSGATTLPARITSELLEQFFAVIHLLGLKGGHLLLQSFDACW